MLTPSMTFPAFPTISFSFWVALSSLTSFKKKIILVMLKNHQQQAGVEKVTSFPMILGPRLRNGLPSDSQAGDEEIMNDQGDPGVYYLTSLVTTDK